MKSQIFTIIPKASIRPSKVVFYNQVIKPKIEKYVSLTPMSKETKAELGALGFGVNSMPVKNSHEFNLSKKAGNRIREKVTWLYELAKSKTIIQDYNQSVICFKMNFITLTLPAFQKHTTAVITSECLNQFLTECKKKYNLENYVWRLEFQKNGNVHYHLATDTYISYTSCKLIWNRCLAKLGYISDYAEKFGNMTFEEYRQATNSNGLTPFNVLRERYGRGCATRWDSPNTVDVRAVGNAKNIAHYISKYITKPSADSTNSIVFNREPKESNLRMWFCSRSLSRLSAIEVFLDEYNDLTDKVLSGIEKARKYIFDYCSVWYFSARDQTNETRVNLWLLYRQYSKLCGYVSA